MYSLMKTFLNAYSYSVDFYSCFCACVTDGTSGGRNHYPFGGDVAYEDSFGPSGPTEPEQEYKPHPQKVYTSSITINPPASFRPIPISEQEAAVPKPAPPAVPPKPFKDTSVFQNVDLHAVEVNFIVTRSLLFA
jgi:hypothetical protein